MHRALGVAASLPLRAATDGAGGSAKAVLFISQNRFGFGGHTNK